MFGSVLIANRGEIAVRVMRTARTMGLRTIAVYSEADRDALHVRTADEAVPIGPAPARESYLSIEKVIAAARATGAECIHPGYGFLSENAAFAEACAAAGIVFVGPPPAAIRAMGLKDEAKAIMERAGVPVVPGYHGELQDPKFLRQKAYEIGYPLLIKAIAGGGGKGMRRVDKQVEFDDALAAAKREAEGAFGDARVLVEKFVTNPRHVEIQVFADTHGRAVSLNERDCSIQRRHQKVLEEAPAPGMTAEVRRVMGEAAVKAAEAVGYVGAGTVEFIADGAAGLKPDGFWFMEMNTRLQVEHPVTEFVTGVDLVEWQLRVAAGEALPLSGEPPAPRGHAVEVRLYAEDPDHGFLPSAGRLDLLRLPHGEGIRVDSGVVEGDVVSAFYDPMIAKIVVHAPNRQDAFDRLAAALAETLVAGPKSNLAFLRALATSGEVRAGRHDTGYVDRALARLTGGGVDEATIAAAVRLLVEGEADAAAEADHRWSDPWSVRDAFRLSGRPRRELKLRVEGAERRLRLSWSDGAAVIDGAEAPARGRAVRTPGGVYALADGRAVRVELADELARAPEDAGAAGSATAPMHGKIIALHVAPGDAVKRGDRLFAVEAMKMEHTVLAATEGTVVAVNVALGDQVAQGARVVAIDTGETEATADL